MLHKFYPCGHAKSVFKIDYKKLYAKGYRGIIFDIDNTLVHHGDPATKQVEEFFQYIHDIGFETLLLSNNSKERIEEFNKNIKTQYIYEADKPAVTNYLKAVDMLKIDKKKIVVIGDQLFIDILGANNSGISSVFVDFIKLPTEKWIGKRRYIEKVIMLIYKLDAKKYHALDDIML